MRNIYLLAFAFLSLFTYQTLRACNLHPGISHKEWSSSISEEKNKNGSVKTMSDNFFSSAGTGKDQGRKTDSQRSSGERSIRVIR